MNGALYAYTDVVGRVCLARVLGYDADTGWYTIILEDTADGRGIGQRLHAGCQDLGDADLFHRRVSGPRIVAAAERIIASVRAQDGRP